MKSNSFTDKANGSRYNGDVTVEVTHVDPSTDELSGAPRDLSAISNSEDSQLVSYGMVDVSLFGEDGQELSIDLDKPATLRMPITNGSLPDGLQMEPGDIQNTWSFDPIQGTWIEEATGTITATTDQLFFTFEATHFSWWNCDQGFVPSCAEGRVIDFQGFPVRGADVTCAGGQTTSTAVTNDDGEYQCSIMVGDYVSFTGRTFVGGQDWHKTKGSIFMDSEGSSAADCEPIPDIQIDVCRIAGAVNIENYDSIVDINEPEAVGADGISAIFWESHRAQFHIVKILGTASIPANAGAEPTQRLFPCFQKAQSREFRIAHVRQAIGLSFQTIPVLIEWRKASKELCPFMCGILMKLKTVVIMTDRPDFKQGQDISVVADGDFSSYFGSWSVEDFATIPDQVYFSTDTLVYDGGGLLVDYGNASGDHVFFAAILGENQMLCKFDNDGGFMVPADALNKLDAGWGGASVFNLSMELSAGPDGLPIYCASIFRRNCSSAS